MIDINTYLGRITSQHKIKPKYMALLEARLQPLIDLAGCLETFDANFDLDNAVGNQLDIIGQYIGVKRLLTFQPRYESPLLNDYYYRLLLKVRISQNNWDGTTAGIQKIWSGIFPDYGIEVVDNQDMTINIRITGLQNAFEHEIVHHGYIVPKPMGVLVNFMFVIPGFYDIDMYAAAEISTAEFTEFDFVAETPPTVTALYIDALISTVEYMAFDFAANVPPAPSTLFGGIVIMTSELNVFGFSLVMKPPELKSCVGSSMLSSERVVFYIKK